MIGLCGIYIAALTCQDMADQGRFFVSRDNERSQYYGRSELHHDRRCSLPRRPPGRLPVLPVLENRRRGCILGRENCYYLAQVVITEEERKCEGCRYAVGAPCVSACCYKDLERDLWKQREAKAARRKNGHG